MQSPLLSHNRSLQDSLLAGGKTRWLDIGCGGNFAPGFHYMDTFPEGLVCSEYRDRYYRINISAADNPKLGSLKTFDLVRLQHTFEHFTWEEGEAVLRNCATLLNPGGLLLISVPDLRIHIDRYLKKDYKSDKGFVWWASHRIPADAPDSCYFSVFAHSTAFEPHKWCYDSEGLIYRIKTTRLFNEPVEITLRSPLASIPFTHNRPEEDVCVCAEKP
jgi:predicted SAM-dependent methyltransferase